MKQTIVSNNVTNTGARRRRQALFCIICTIIIAIAVNNSANSLHFSISGQTANRESDTKQQASASSESSSSVVSSEESESTGSVSSANVGESTENATQNDGETQTNTNTNASSTNTKSNTDTKSNAAATSNDSTLSASSGSAKTNTITVANGETAENIGTYDKNGIALTVWKVTGSNITYFVADIQLSSVSQLKTAFAYSQYSTNMRQYPSVMAKTNNAILAINGDYYNFRTDGIIIRNSVLYRNIASNRQMLIIDENGNFSFEWESDADADALVSSKVLQTLSFGPALMIGGKEQGIPSQYFIKTNSAEPRTAIGQVGKLHYMFVVVDGRARNYSSGATLLKLRDIMKKLGCTNAYNIDGGGSSTMVFNGEVINRPCNGGDGGERSISDIVYIG